MSLLQCNNSYNRRKLVALLQWLTEPQSSVYIKSLRKAYDAYQVSRQPETLIGAIRELYADSGGASRENVAGGPPAGEQWGLVRREDVRLICFEYVWE